MLLAQQGSDSLHSLEPFIIVIAIASVLFWRVALKMLAIVLVVLLISGVILLLGAMHTVG